MPLVMFGKKMSSYPLFRAYLSKQTKLKKKKEKKTFISRKVKRSIREAEHGFGGN